MQNRSLDTKLQTAFAEAKENNSASQLTIVSDALQIRLAKFKISAERFLYEKSQLLALGYLSEQIEKLIIRQSSVKTVKALLDNHSVLINNFTHEQLYRIAQHYGGSKNIEAVKSAFVELTHLKFTPEQIVKIAANNGGSKNIEAVKSAFHELTNLKFTPEQIIKIAANIGGSKNIEAVKTAFHELTTLKFMPEQIVKIAANGGGSKNIEAIQKNVKLIAEYQLSPEGLSNLLCTANGRELFYKATSQNFAEIYAQIIQIKNNDSSFLASENNVSEEDNMLLEEKTEIIETIPNNNVTNSNKVPDTDMLANQTSVSSHSLFNQSHKRKAQPIKNSTKQLKINNEEKSAETIKVKLEPSEPRIININQILRALSQTLKQKRKGNNAAENCGYITEYTLLALENLLNDKPAPEQNISTESSYTTAISITNKNKILIKKEDNSIADTRIRTIQANAIRTNAGINSLLPGHSIFSIDLTTNNATITETVDLVSEQVPYLRAEVTNITNLLKQKAEAEEGILTGHIMLTRTGNSNITHYLTFCATDQHVYYIDAQQHDGITEIGSTIYIDELEGIYPFAKPIYGQHQGEFGHFCFYLIHQKITAKVDYSDEAENRMGIS